MCFKITQPVALPRLYGTSDELSVVTKALYPEGQDLTLEAEIYSYNLQ